MSHEKKEEVYAFSSRHQKEYLLFDQDALLPSMKEDILRVYRLFVGWLLFLGGSAWMVNWLRFSGDLRLAWKAHPFPFLALSLLFTWTSVYLYLKSRWLKERLGDLYLPLALGITTLLPILGMATQLALSPDALVRKRLLMGPPFVVSLLPLVLIAWRYRVRHILAFSLGTLGIDLLLWLWVLEQGLFWELAQWGGHRTAIFVLSGVLINRLVQGQMEQGIALIERNHQLRHYAASLEALAASRERVRLARELHDTVAHALSALILQLEGTKALWEKEPEEAHAMLGASLETARSGLVETRRAMRALRASPLQIHGFTEALRKEARSIAEQHDLIFCDQIEAFEGIDSFEEQALYRIALEAVRNVAKHANASQFTCSLSRIASQGVLLEVVDDGDGFDTQEESEQWGVIGMHERIREIGGHLQIQSEEGKGTKVSVFLPNRTHKI